jgi:hypothetical protein
VRGRRFRRDGLHRDLYRRVIGKEAPVIGLGVGWGNLIYQHVYKSGADLSRFVPVLTDRGSPAHIPEPAAGASYYCIGMAIGYEGLLRGLFNRPRVISTAWVQVYGSDVAGRH